MRHAAVFSPGPVAFCCLLWPAVQKGAHPFDTPSGRVQCLVESWVAAVHRETCQKTSYRLSISICGSRVCLDKSSCSFFSFHQGERKEEFWRQNGRERFSRSLTWRRRFRPDACTPVWHHRCRVDKKRPPGFLSFRRLLDREIGEELQENAWVYF